MNNVILCGRLGTDVEQIKENVHKVSLATSRKYTKKNGEAVDETQWHSLVLFGASGANFAKYHRKGDRVLVTGRINYRLHEDKYYTSIIVDRWEFVKDVKSNIITSGEYSSSTKNTNASVNKIADMMPEKYKTASLPNSTPIGDEDLPF